MTPKGCMSAAPSVVLVMAAVVLVTADEGTRSRASDMTHVVVAGDEGRFLAWPANNGVWTWDDGNEILIGHSEGPWLEDPDGHNIGDPILTKLARSTDGGKTWRSEDPRDFVGDGGEPRPSPGNINFGHPDFAMRVVATGYLATDDTAGMFFISYDRGRTWSGPYRFNNLMEDPHLDGLVNTSRTSYLVTGQDSCLIFMSARKTDIDFASRLDKPFVAETTDGGKTFRFVSWIVPWTDQYRAVMPSAVRTEQGDIVAALRRRNPRDEDQACWVDAYVSHDNGRRWSFLGRVGETGVHNGNPPALTLLEDGRLAIAYGNRTTRQILARVSKDGGRTWGDEIIIREHPPDSDIGYPTQVQNARGELVTMYYWLTKEQPHQYIAATIWKP